MTHREQVLELLSNGSVLRGRDFKNAGIPAVVLTRMLKANELESPQRGVYRIPHPEDNETNLKVSEIAARHPSGVLCLMSALRFHGMTDDMNSEWTIAIRRTSPVTTMPWLRPIRWTNPEAFVVGVDAMRIAGADVQITNPARTVADIMRRTYGYSDEHALKAFSAFLKDGGDPIAVGNYARRLGFGPDAKRLVPFAQELMSNGAFQSMDMSQFAF